MKNRKVSFEEACHLLKKGDVVSIPTETVYGLAGDINNEEAIKKIFQIKKRPLFDPLIVHAHSLEQIKNITRYSSKVVDELSQMFHPGPLTLVLPKKNVSDLITANLNTVAVRIPSHPIALKLLKETDLLLAAPSANLFSKTSPTCAEHVDLPVPVLDGGACDVGIESTILEVKEDKKVFNILRPGMIGEKELRPFLDQGWSIQTSQKGNHPGQSKSHYTPDVPLVIFKTKKEVPKEKIIEEVQKKYPSSEPKEYLMSDDPYIFARSLYYNLKKLSQNKKSVIYIVLKEENQSGTWEAIWNRLEKASSQIISI